MRWFVNRWTFGFLISLSLAALAASAHAAPPAGGKANGTGKAVSPPQTPEAIAKAPVRRGPLIDPDGR